MIILVPSWLITRNGAPVDSTGIWTTQEYWWCISKIHYNRLWINNCQYIGFFKNYIIGFADPNNLYLAIKSSSWINLGLRYCKTYFSRSPFWKIQYGGQNWFLNFWKNKIFSICITWGIKEYIVPPNSLRSDIRNRTYKKIRVMHITNRI